jgi:cytochrome c biogenesis protein CcdA
MSLPPPPAAPPPPPGFDYGAGAQAVNDGKAIGALVCGILAFFVPCAGLVLAIVAIVLGVQSRNTIAAANGRLKGRGMATAGLILGIVALAVGALWTGVLIARA